MHVTNIHFALAMPHAKCNCSSHVFVYKHILANKYHIFQVLDYKAHIFWGITL